MELTTPISKVLRTRQEYIDVLKELNIETVEDLIMYLPKAYEDLSRMQTLATANINEKCTIRGIIDDLKLVRTRSRKQLVQGKFADSDGNIAKVVWFNQPHIMRMISSGDEIVLTGKLIEKGYSLEFQSPQFESTQTDELIHTGKLVPIYSQHEIITTKWMREKMISLRDAINKIPETLPKEVLINEELLSRSKSIYALHFPEDGEQLKKAKKRMAFEEMFNIQLEALKRKKEWRGERRENLQIPMDIELIKSFFASLKFTPTGSQKIAIYEILKDMESGKAMSRLLEGDVGSGKTLVATAVMANVIKHGGQCAFMVPTEVLASQHTENIAKTLIAFQKYLEKQEDQDKMHLPLVAFLTGSVTKKQSESIKNDLKNGKIDLIIGTHALIEDSVIFKNLKLVIVDEQHRFGVAQREKLKEKGNPHFLSMTATPIPRTLALTGYGHHDLSVLLEKPGNRKTIETKVVSPKNRKTVEAFINHQIDEGKQVFVVCPLISESKSEEMNDIKNVNEEAARLKESFSNRKISLLHGKMTPAEKQSAMQSFKDKQSDILVSTSVIEVGIDVPNASIIIIEGAERFGLAQLHQFRGRVGRADHKSYCFLFTTNPEQSRCIRLKAMEKESSGFALAEIDLKLRGPGEIYGIRQSGLPDLQFSSLLNPELVFKARKAAENVINNVKKAVSF
ncbi:MAG: ATP-dependent DNA helicase RecG [Candidatus Peribacteraceae bacterium]|nr:ATP-dependent DNA helicase RecG [Candidatus Peribacteraceae bacterium]